MPVQCLKGSIIHNRYHLPKIPIYQIHSQWKTGQMDEACHSQNSPTLSFETVSSLDSLPYLEILLSRGSCAASHTYLPKGLVLMPEN
jgi:hypothetical protein